MNRRRFLLALGLMIVAPKLAVDEVVTEAASYPEPGDLTPAIPPMPAPVTIEVQSSHGLRVGDDVAIIDLETGFKEFFVITAIDGTTMTGYRP